MANKYIYKVLRVALMGVGLMLSACANTLELATPIGRDRSQDRVQAIRNAVAYFDNHRAFLTRSANADPSEVAPFSTGNIVTDWESAVTLSGEEKRYTDFSMRKDNRFYLLLGQEGEQREAVELYSRFASVEDFGLDTMNQYVATYIPDVEYLQSYYNVAHDYGINCAEWYEFSGVVMYTRPSGHYVAAYRYEEGILAERSFLYDKEKTTEENIADFCSVMEGLTLGVAVAQEGTRGDDYLAYIEHIIVVDNITGWQAPELEHLFPEEYEIVEPTFENLEGAGGGGGGDSSSEKEEEEPTVEDRAKELFENYDSLTPLEQQELKEAMQQIIEDCMGKALAKALSADTISITYGTTYPNNFSIPDAIKDVSAYIYDQEMLVYRGEGSDVLLHELFHVYQHNVLSESDFEAASANLEIEAQVARTLFAIRLKDKGNSDCYNNINNQPLGRFVIHLSKSITHTGNIMNDVRNNYFILYNYFAEYIEDKYKYVYDTTLLTNAYDNLHQLSQNCE